MNAFTRRLTLLAIGIAALALITTSPAHARGKAVLRIQAAAVQGQVVTVAVANPSRTPRRVTIEARVLTTGGIVAVTGSVDVGAGQTGTVRMDLPATPLDLPPLGVVVDDGVPF